MLADADAKQAMFDKISRMSLDGQPPAPRSRGRRLVGPVAVAASVVVVSVGVLAWSGLTGPDGRAPLATTAPSRSAQQTPAPARQGDAFAPGVTTSCLEAYSRTTLAGRTFAFDGTVLSVADRPADDDGSDPYVSVTFTVTRWYRGGQGEQATIAMFPPGTHASESGAGYTIGSRLLVSGADRWGSARLRDPIAWACGFTRWYNRTDAQLWEQVFR
ncbi:hypothetical protein O7600_28330 [Micromonospora sp. WMMA1998]|uniref:hypothetical protein n=1 Tax=Micromonospora sp. WMMA1998 TaxID=3015167 RepID=UPI00248CF8A4|nr:hypothetical protein [Micromonospora sp. WMMA1998]WBC14922.1 hypothetical protein O7600_28330 [Micromonospora sp. WMMA1998]